MKDFARPTYEHYRTLEGAVSSQILGMHLAFQLLQQILLNRLCAHHESPKTLQA